MPDTMLASDRACGSCTECCRTLSVDATTLSKPAGITCPHVARSGCGIYPDRPADCREWSCGWRLSGTLGDEWRPDRSGILAEILSDERVEGYHGPTLRFTLLRSPSDALWGPFMDLVAKALAKRQPVYLCLAGPPGCPSASSFLNVPAFVAAVDSGDREAIRRCLRRAGECLEQRHWERRSA
ncbi:MAG: hypothetical protein J0I80_15825 [Sphingomonas sp.]|nr:hypothetical protein [Sphingomonas sp.]